MFVMKYIKDVTNIHITRLSSKLSHNTTTRSPSFALPILDFQANCFHIQPFERHHSFTHTFSASRDTRGPIKRNLRVSRPLLPGALHRTKDRPYTSAQSAFVHTDMPISAGYARQQSINTDICIYIFMRRHSMDPNSRIMFGRYMYIRQKRGVRA